MEDVFYNAQPLCSSFEDEINRKLPMIIRGGGQIAKSFFANNPKREFKEDNTIVTEADAAVQRYIVHELGKFEKNIPVIAEEDGLDKEALNNPEYIWVIDPIDGTSQFANDLDNWVVAIALLKNYKPCAGWIYQPTIDKLYYAPIGDTHAYLEIKDRHYTIPKISNKEGHSLTKKDIICIGSRAFSKYKLKRNNARIQCLGSLTLHALETVLGHSVGAFSFNNKIWDLCAVAEIAKRTDVDIKYISGNEINYEVIIIGEDKTLEDDVIIAHNTFFSIIKEHLTRYSIFDLLLEKFEEFIGSANSTIRTLF
jgi:fructose-1,6-bisphosphatase/inositol monophosphatase family enzyme